MINQQYKSVPFESLKTGDIIAFKNQFNKDIHGNEVTMTHRIVQIKRTADSGIVIRTKGDNNPASISEIDYPIYKQNYIGKVVYIIPKLGIILLGLTYPPITFGIIAAVLMPSLYFLVFKNVRKEKTT